MPGISASRAARVAERRHRGHQRPGVGMARPVEQLEHGRLLDLAAGVHHHHAVAALGDDAEVVGDHDHAHAELALQALDQVEDLRLDGDVEGGGRLVGDQQLGPAGQGEGDHHPLPHAAGELVRILGGAALGLRDLHQLAASRPRAASPRRGRASGAAARISAICRPTLSTGLSEVIGSWKIIEMRSPRIARISLLGEREQVAAAVAHRAAVAPGRHRHQAQDRERGDALAAARFADDAERLAVVHRERDAVDRAHRADERGEGRAQVRRPRGAGGFAVAAVTSFTAASPGADRARRAGRRPPC